jgi:ABC-type multidrug transport system permease subunit
MRRSSDSWSIVLAVWILLTVTLFFLMAIAYVIVERESKVMFHLILSLLFTLL